MGIAASTRRVGVAAMTEQAFQAAVVELARLLGWRCFYVGDSRRSPHGWPDLTLVRDRLIFRELKSEKGRLTGEQEEWGRLLAGAGMDWAVWRPGDWPEIERSLR